MRGYRRALVMAAACLAVIALAGAAGYALYGTGRGGIAQIGGPFSLVDHRGRTTHDTDFRGRYMLVYFGYTFCPDICPSALQIMAAALDELEAPRRDRITPVFITIDPGRDTTAHLAEYVASFHPRMIGLTGSGEQVAAAARAYRVYFGKSADSGSDSDYLMDHSSIIFLMDPDGGYVTHFTHATAPDRIVAALRNHVGT